MSKWTEKELSRSATPRKILTTKTAPTFPVAEQHETIFPALQLSQLYEMLLATNPATTKACTLPVTVSWNQTPPRSLLAPQIPIPPPKMDLHLEMQERAPAAATTETTIHLRHEAGITQRALAVMTPRITKSTFTS
jgi:hypothetical protein